MCNVPIYTDTAYLHHAPHVRSRAQLDEPLERPDVDRFELFRGRMHVEMHAGQVEHSVDAIQRLREASRLANVLHPKVHGAPRATLGSRLGPRRWMHVDRPYLEAAVGEIRREVRAHEA